MAVDNIKDFGVMFILAAFLFTSLLYFATGFTDKNNPDALGSIDNKFRNFSGEFQSSLINTREEGNNLFNISAESDPEVSILGSRDSVATAYTYEGNSGSFFDKIGLFFEWVIPGSNGVIIMAVLGGLFAFSLAWFGFKAIRGLN